MHRDGASRRRVRRAGLVCLGLAGLALGFAVAVDASAPDSPRLARAKEYIADERWSRAIGELRGALADPREPAPDEVRFWLAHSLAHAGDTAAALATIEELEARYPRSRWVRPARALRIEIAQRLRRDDLLWRFVTPPPLPPPPPPAPPAPPRPPEPPEPLSDLDLRIQALSTLMRTHAEQVIPALKELVFALGEAGEARRALFVLAQSDRPEARAVVVEVARQGPEAMRIAAVRELGRRRDPAVVADLLDLYPRASPDLRYQIVEALGRLRRADALARIAREEREADVRDAAIVWLGLSGGRDELRALYPHVGSGAKAAVVTALFNAGADDELIEIAKGDPDVRARHLAVEHLRLLDTAKARAFLATLK